ncbi:DUF808 domain-containing protein [Gordonia humi]|uniref:ABC transporter n=1 Tax=Gordonia humi TaxID=686429 RepID=A0A840FBZ1_9ACTN|nr:DUF808 domain-containing protein [Gordonia humi]MBB4137630.1 hypothetical protein [Gordonia humi]
MSAGLAALLDDIAVLAKMSAASLDDVAAGAAKASTKAIGVVVDDTAVTPRYVHGVRPQRELPIIGRIAKGSLRNKLLIILPVALILSQWLPWLLTPILMVGGTYLCFEGAEKVWEWISGHGKASETAEQIGDDQEKSVVSGAIRTDFILSAEIMVIALNEVVDEPFVARAVILVIVGILITALVYGVVAVIVKMDDVGLALAERQARAVSAFGRGLVTAMPVVLTVLSTVGVIAMCWVGGHIVLQGADELGWALPYSVVHHVEHWAAGLIESIGDVVGWIAGTLCSAVFGVVWGALVLAASRGAAVLRHRGAH